jgi:Ring finger domain/BAG domain
VFRLSKERQDILKKSLEEDMCPICYDQYEIDD